MNIVTRGTLAQGVTVRWRKQYLKDKVGTLQLLKDLGGNPNPDDVDRIIGNGSWTRVPDCNECEQPSDAVICIGEESDYDSATAFVCRICLITALKSLDDEKITKNTGRRIRA